MRTDAETHTATPTRSDERVRHVTGSGIEPGATVGRYQVIELLGIGGLGSVYRAHDPHLSRDVALKLLHPRAEPEARSSAYQERLVREARALARVSHPNIVSVYDVGAHAGAVFVAMELVRGQSLHTWLSADRTPSEILTVLLAAGRGLAAAHAAGVIHGDVKPANVMVSTDGRVRVVDFGLARGVDEREPESPLREVVPGDALSATLAPTELTESARLRGTPGYLAPELVAGEAASDEKADQYSYAATAFVALTGRKPFPGATMVEYRAALSRGERMAWTPAIPRRIRRVIERGLAPRPQDRYPQLEGLLGDLEPSATPRSRARVWGALSLVGALVVGGTAWVRAGPKHTPCTPELDPLAGVWDGQRRNSLQQAFRATGRPNHDEAFELLSGRLDAFASEWSTMKKAACEATLVRGEQSEQMLALRNDCLKHKREGVAALVNAFAEPDATTVDRAAGTFPDSLAPCADTATLLGKAERLPVDSAVRAAIDEIESGLAIVRASISAGRDQREPANELLERARALGHRPTIALALSSVARANENAIVGADREKGRALLIEARQQFNESMAIAAEVGDRQLLARTASYVFNIVAFREKRAEEADAMFPMVDALVNGAGNDPELRQEVLVSQGSILSQRGNYEEAIEVFERAIALTPRVQSNLRAYGAMAQGQLGEIYLQLERYPEAVRSRKAELEGLRGIYGTRHIHIIMSLFHLGLAQVKAGLLSDARSTAASLSEQIDMLLSPGDWRVATREFLEGNIWEFDGNCPRALPLYRDALERVASYYGRNHNNAVDVHERLGSCLTTIGHVAEGVAELEQGLAIRREFGAAPNKIAVLAFQLGDVLWSKGTSAQRPRAISLVEEAEALWLDDGVSERAEAAKRWLTARRPSPSLPSASHPAHAR